MKILVTASASKSYVPTKLVKRLVEQRPFWRDLQARLLKMPLLKRGHFVTDLPETDDLLIKYGQERKWTFAFGYRIRTFIKKDTIDTLLMCIDEKGRVVEPESDRLNHTNYFVGMRVPEQDIKSRKYAINFERMEYVMKNLET